MRRPAFVLLCLASSEPSRAMPYDDQLAARLKTAMPEREGLEETRMFGGFGYLLRGNMCCGVHREHFMFRLGIDGFGRLSEQIEELKPMDFTGRVMKGWGMIYGRHCSEGELETLSRTSLDFAASLPAKGKAKARS